MKSILYLICVICIGVFSLSGKAFCGDLINYDELVNINAPVDKGVAVILRPVDPNLCTPSILSAGKNIYESKSNNILILSASEGDSNLYISENYVVRSINKAVDISFEKGKVKFFYHIVETPSLGFSAYNNISCSSSFKEVDVSAFKKKIKAKSVPFVAFEIKENDDRSLSFVAFNPKAPAASAEQKPDGESLRINPVQAQTGSPQPDAAGSDVETLPAALVRENANAYAIIIGIEQYRERLPRADFAENDARLLSRYLTKVLGYPEENVVVLLNDRALKSDLTKYIERWLPNNVEPGGTVFVYYSGHGAPNPKTGDAYLVPYDGDPAFIDETGYSLGRMYAALGKLPAKEVVVALDSCFSGAGGRSVIARGARSITLSLKNLPVPSRNMTVLAASSGEQMSSTYDAKGHGLFTYFLLKGIRDQGVVAADGSLRIHDLFAYLQPQVERVARKQYNNEQVPQLIEAD